MAERDLITTTSERIAHNIETFSGNDTSEGLIIDMFGFESLTFVMQVGVIGGANGDSTLLIEHGDAANLSDAVDVPDDFLLGTEADTLRDTSFSIAAIGYNGKKQFVRATLLIANIANNLTVGVTAVLADAVSQPTT